MASLDHSKRINVSCTPVGKFDKHDCAGWPGKVRFLSQPLLTGRISISFVDTVCNRLDRTTSKEPLRLHNSALKCFVREGEKVYLSNYVILHRTILRKIHWRVPEREQAHRSWPPIVAIIWPQINAAYVSELYRFYSFYQRVSIASYASAGIARAEMSVRLSVRPSVRHTPVLYQNEES